MHTCTRARRLHTHRPPTRVQAVTATGAIILAASEEFVALRTDALRRARREGRDAQLRPSPDLTAHLTADLAAEAGGAGEWQAGVGSHVRGVGATEAGLLRDGEPSLWDLGLFIFDNASPGAAAAIERLRHQTLERLGQQSQDMAQEHAAAESASIELVRGQTRQVERRAADSSRS